MANILYKIYKKVNHNNNAREKKRTCHPRSILLDFILDILHSADELDIKRGH